METKRDRMAWLKGGTAVCKPPPEKSKGRAGWCSWARRESARAPRRELLAEKLGACQLSTGDIFRGAKSLDPGERSPAMTAALGVHAARRVGAR